MDTVSLRYFLEVARQRSLSKAAITLGVVQPALTRRIRLLEERLGTPLLTRHRRGVEPTEAGRLLMDRAELILRLTRQAEEETRSHSREPIGQVRFGFPPSTGGLFVGRLISLCLKRYPQITLALHEHYSPAMREGLLNGRLDLGIMSCEAHHPELVMRPLFEEDACLFGLSSSWPFKVDALPAKVLNGLPIVVGSFMREIIERQQAKSDLRLRVVAEADSGSLGREILRAGVGFFVGPFSSLDREVKSGEVTYARLKGITISRGLFHHRDRPLTRPAQALVELLDREIIDHLPKQAQAIRLIQRPRSKLK